MSVDAPAFQPQGFLLGQAMARGLSSKKRVTAGILLAISPNPMGVAATLSMVRSARRAQHEADPKPPGDPKNPDGSGQTGGTSPTVDPVTRAEIVQDAKEMLDAVTDAAGAVGAAARQSAETQAKMLALLSERDGTTGAPPPGSPPPPPPAAPSPPPSAARKAS